MISERLLAMLSDKEGPNQRTSHAMVAETRDCPFIQSDFGLPYIGPLLYVHLASLFYIIRVGLDDTARARSSGWERCILSHSKY